MFCRCAKISVRDLELTELRQLAQCLVLRSAVRKIVKSAQSLCEVRYSRSGERSFLSGLVAQERI